MLRDKRAFSIYLILTAFISFNLGNLSGLKSERIESAAIAESIEEEFRSHEDVFNPEGIVEHSHFLALAINPFYFQNNIRFIHVSQNYQLRTFTSHPFTNASGRSPPLLS